MHCVCNAPSLGTVHLKTELDAVAVSVPRRVLKSLRMCVHMYNAGVMYINCTVSHIYLHRVQSASILKETPPSVITALSPIEDTAHWLTSKFRWETMILEVEKHS